MSATTNTSENRNDSFTAHLTVRVPENDGGTLAESATRRLETQSPLDTVEVLSLRGLEPGLSATTAAFELSVRTTERTTERTVENALQAAPGTESVDRVEVG